MCGGGGRRGKEGEGGGGGGVGGGVVCVCVFFFSLYFILKCFIHIFNIIRHPLEVVFFHVVQVAIGTDTGPSRWRRFVPHLAPLIRTPRSIFQKWALIHQWCYFMCLNMIFDQMHIDIFYHYKFVFPKVYTSSHKTYDVVTPNITT